MVANVVTRAWGLPVVNGRRNSKFTVGVPPTPLALAITALSAGSGASYTPGLQSGIEANGLEWQTACWHDTINGLVHLLGKHASADETWEHNIFTLSSETWSGAANLGYESAGHIYGNSTIDPSTGILYLMLAINNPGSADNIKREALWTPATGLWTRGPVDLTAGGMEDIGNGLCVHPNYFGEGLGALLYMEQDRLMTRRFSNNALATSGFTAQTYGTREAGGVYWDAQNCCIMGGSSDGVGAAAGSLARIDAGGSITNLGVPPIPVAGHARGDGSSPLGSLHVHPSNSNKLIIVGTNNTDVYESDDGAEWTQVTDHPFTTEPRLVCRVQDAPGLWAIGFNYSHIWRPS
jgi:hypothetical protein